MAKKVINSPARGPHGHRTAVVDGVKAWTNDNRTGGDDANIHIDDDQVIEGTLAFG
ncbi:MAG: hypothetical protein Q9187_005172 [Circinaria calcarea]